LAQPVLGPEGGLFAEAARLLVPRYTSVTSEQLDAAAAEYPEIVALLRELQVESALHTPLMRGGRAVGMLTLVYAGSGRQYGPADLDIVQEVTRRAAVALENAQLYAEAQHLNTELEARVASRTAQLAAANVNLEAEVVERKRMEAELAQSHAQLRQLNAYMQAAREDERTRISREIHDELGGTLTGLKMDVARTRKVVSDADQVSARLQALSDMIDEMVRTVRRIATDLRPALLDDFGLAAAIEWQLQEFEKRSGLACQFDSLVGELEWDAAASTGVFRAFQETLTNVARHAQATRLTVSLTQAEADIELRVQDNGRGITTGELAGLKSLGLAGMRERIEALSGRVTITGRPGAGTTVIIQVPLARLLRQPPAGPDLNSAVTKDRTTTKDSAA
jgi:signal transduction histidine kinase